jgi:hypothetical protein
MANEPLLSYPYAAGTDLLSAGDDAIRALAEAVRLRSLMRFASAAARTAAFAAASLSPSEGMESWLDDVDRYEFYDGAQWLPRIAVWGAYAASAPDVQTAITNTEKDLPGLQILNRSARNGRMYRFAGHLDCNINANAADSWQVRVREGTAVSGTVLGLAFVVPTITAVFDLTIDFIMDWRCTADDADLDLFLSIQRISGSGTINSVRGNGRSSWAVQDMGPAAGQWSIT